MGKPLSVDDFEASALEISMEGLKAIRAYLTHQGRDNAMDKWLREKAKAGAAVVTSYTRIYSAKTNRESVQIAATKAGLIDRAEAKKLSA